MEQKLLDLVKFDSEQLRGAIRELRDAADKMEKEKLKILQLAAAYEQLLILRGSTEQQPAIESIASNKSPETISDAVFTIISEKGGRAHGKAILDAIKARGFLRSVKYPVNQLTNTLRRHRMIERVSGAPNTWRIKKQE